MVEFQRLNAGRRVDIVATVLTRAIMNGRIKPGERLPSEREMAQQFGVARLVVREALRSLETTGLIQVKRGVKGGCFVREQSPRHFSKSLTNMLYIGRVSLQDVLEARLGLESNILRLAVERATRADLKKIDQNVRETKALTASDSDPALREKVHEFHLLLAQAAKNPLYTLMMHSILDVIDAYMKALGYASLVSKHTIKEHEDIFRFMTSQNSEKALAALQSHILADNHRLSRRAAKLKVTQIEYLPAL